MKKKLIQIFLLTASGVGLLLITGCETMRPAESNIPWSRPAPWQNSAPGVSF